MESLTTVPLLIIDDFGMRKLPLTAAEDPVFQMSTEDKGEEEEKRSKQSQFAVGDSLLRDVAP